MRSVIIVYGFIRVTGSAQQIQNTDDTRQLKQIPEQPLLMLIARLMAQHLQLTKLVITSRDVYFGIAVNSSSGTTNIQGDAAQLIYSYIKDNVIQPITIIHRLAVNDVITAKGGTGSSFMPDASGEQDSFIIIRKINNG